MRRCVTFRVEGGGEGAKWELCRPEVHSEERSDEESGATSLERTISATVRRAVRLLLLTMLVQREKNWVGGPCSFGPIARTESPKVLLQPVLQRVRNLHNSRCTFSIGRRKSAFGA